LARAINPNANLPPKSPPARFFQPFATATKWGLILFSDEVEKFIPPRKGRSPRVAGYSRSFIFRTQAPRDRFERGVGIFPAVTAHKAIAVVISDFIGSPAAPARQEQAPPASAIDVARIARASLVHDASAG